MQLSKEIGAGTFFIAVGAFFTANAYFNLSFGTSVRMGPGYFPVVLGVLQMGLGALILLRPVLLDAGKQSARVNGRVPVRAVICIGAAPALFGLTVQGLGLVGALALSTAVASLSSKPFKPVTAILLTLGLTVFCIAIFHYGLGLPIRMVGPWLSRWPI